MRSEEGFETSDASPVGILIVVLALFLSGVALERGLRAMFRLEKNKQRSFVDRVYPPHVEAALSSQRQGPAQPRLQVDSAADYARFYAEQMKRLASFPMERASKELTHGK